MTPKMSSKVGSALDALAGTTFVGGSARVAQAQIDLPTGRTSGLVEAMKVVNAIEGISFVHFDERDVVRHKLVQQIVKAYEAFSNGNGRHPA